MPTTNYRPSVIAQLRALMPDRPLTRLEAMQVAERQATLLLDLTGVEAPPVPEGVITDLPRLTVERMSPLPMSGYTGWTRGRWRIVLNGSEPIVRQRFSLFHEDKNLIDHPFITQAYGRVTDEDQAAHRERICDYFAASVLMPRAWVKSLYCNRGVQDLRTLARHFGVSQTAMRVRLLQLGLSDPAPRCRPYNRHADPSAVDASPVAFPPLRLKVVA